MVNCDKIQLGG